MCGHSGTKAQKSGDISGVLVHDRPNLSLRAIFFYLIESSYDYSINLKSIPDKKKKKIDHGDKNRRNPILYGSNKKIVKRGY